MTKDEHSIVYRDSSVHQNRILVADDDITIRELLQSILQRENFDVLTVDNGSSALDILTEPLAPPLAILDWKMPELSGIELCKKIRRIKDHGTLYIIMITANNSSVGAVSALDAGADDFLGKPFRRSELLARVQAGHRIICLSQEKLEMINQLQQQQRLEAVGQLAAGIAHEINTPMQYIGDNTRFIQDALQDVFELLSKLDSAKEKIEAGIDIKSGLQILESAFEEADIEFLKEQIPEAITQSLEGIARVAKIVQAMKEFAHPGSGQATETDINHLVETAVTVTRNEWKYVASMSVHLTPGVLPLRCHIGDLHQALVNLIVNAAHAVADSKKDKGEISVRTRSNNNSIVIEVADNGCGIPPGIQNRVMDPFFTTKEVGRGTGQGLAIVRSVVVDKHNGTIDFKTEVGKGTTFIITLPSGDA